MKQHTITFIVFAAAAAAATIVLWKRWKPCPRPRWTTSLDYPLATPALVTAVIFLLGTLPTLFHRVPPPSIHDEITYLFMAKTFLKLRLTNPPPPAWESLQTFHTLMQPSYAGKFPPAQGFALAVGMLLNWTVLGALGTVALACGAICWAAQAIVPRGWAMVAGLLAGIHPEVFASWGQTYFGGGTSMLGGALLLGAALRIPRARRWTNGIVFGIGVAILANSRPFEGLVLVILTSAWLAIETARQKNWNTLLKLGVAPAAVVMLPVGAWMMYYNYRVTLDPLRMPYGEHARQYMRAPLFYWQSDNQPTQLLIQKLNLFHNTIEYDEFQRGRSIAGLLRELKRRFGIYRDPTSGITAGGVWQNLFLPWEWLLIVIPALLGLWRTTRRAEALLLAGVVIASPLIQALCTPFLRVHYFGPIAAFWFALIALGLYELCRRQEALRWIVCGAIVGTIAASAVTLVFHFSMNDLNPFARDRQNFVRELNRMPGKHLVFIRYKEGPQQIFEWVYNEPDVEDAKIVFAHLLDREHNDAVIKAYPDRHRWLLEIDEKEARVRLRPRLATSGPASEAR